MSPKSSLPQDAKSVSIALTSNSPDGLLLLSSAIGSRGGQKCEFRTPVTSPGNFYEGFQSRRVMTTAGNNEEPNPLADRIAGNRAGY